MITDQLTDFLSSVPPELATVILATLPVGELRGALPVALVVYQLPLWLAVFLSVLGNIIPVYFLLLFFEHVSKWIEHNWEFGNRILQKLYDRTRRKLEGSVEKYGPWALILFVGIPLPVTGAWTVTLAAFVFGLSKKKAFISIFLGLLISATIVTFLTLGTTFTVGALAK